ncbi:MAG: single-stranded-DNA-specific exonuclease RecJ [Clostridiaceae bacterium]|jgi:single-stranded-DNA-specific exonuclease|nr:single-stranded-DNA-specific exonuclease RecJ [Clostridiaceae bacterium]
MKKEWKYNSYEGTEKSLVKRLLISRGITKEEDMYEFTHPLETKQMSPDAFCDMEKCVTRISKAIDEKEKIVIHGDFDADGVTATSVLIKTLRFLGADVNYFIPDREKEGHGLDTKTLIKIMTQIKPKVLISVDCGISDIDEVKFLNSFKIDTIITDHHEAPEILPEAFAILNPKAKNALSDTLSTQEIESMTSLAGVGVAYKLACGLLQKYDKMNFVTNILPFVAIGTVADVVPLIHENRFLVAKGLDLISKGKHEGIKKLLENAGYKLENGITAEQIAFGIAPRINASGRLDTVENAIKVLISDNPQEVQMSILALEDFNKTRQTLCNDAFAEADDMLKQEGNRNPAIILFNKNWHVGIVGIVASKLVEKYYKPTFMMTYSEETKQVRCSIRSIEGLNIYDVLCENSELFDGFGGHAMAAGLSFSPEKVPFETVKAALNKTIKEFLQGKELKPFVNIDLVVKPDDITVDMVEEIANLEPFGASNPNPIFAMKNLTIKEKRLMGEDKNHLRITGQIENHEFNCIRWQMGDIKLTTGDAFDVAFHPQINEYNGNTSVQLIIDDIHSEFLQDEDEETENKIKVYDHRKKTDILPLVNDYVKSSKQNIKIYAESKTVLDTIRPFKSLFENTFSRKNLQACDAVMFFDYPADEETLNLIIEKTQPKAVHFMKYEIKTFDEEEFLSTVYKMIKYACHNNSGKIDIDRFASFLGKSYKVLDLLFKILEEAQIIEITEQTPEFYMVKLSENTELVNVLHSEKYPQLLNLIDEDEQFQKGLLEDDLIQL